MNSKQENIRVRMDDLAVPECVVDDDCDDEVDEEEEPEIEYENVALPELHSGRFHSVK